jgi:hypothetical protein
MRWGYIIAFVRSYVRTFVRSYVRTYVRTFVRPLARAREESRSRVLRFLFIMLPLSHGFSGVSSFFLQAGLGRGGRVRHIGDFVRPIRRPCAGSALQRVSPPQQSIRIEVVNLRRYSRRGGGSDREGRQASGGSGGPQAFQRGVWGAAPPRLFAQGIGAARSVPPAQRGEWSAAEPRKARPLRACGAEGVRPSSSSSSL